MRCAAYTMLWHFTHYSRGSQKSYRNIPFVCCYNLRRRLDSHFELHPAKSHSPSCNPRTAKWTRMKQCLSNTQHKGLMAWRVLYPHQFKSVWAFVGDSAAVGIVLPETARTISPILTEQVWGVGQCPHGISIEGLHKQQQQQQHSNNNSSIMPSSYCVMCSQLPWSCDLTYLFFSITNAEWFQTPGVTEPLIQGCCGGIDSSREGLRFRKSTVGN